MKHLLVALLTALTPLSLQAHPHAWIDVDSTVSMDTQGNINAIEQDWQFDDLYTSAILMGLKKDSPEERDVVSQFAAEVIANLQPFNYFMRVTADQEIITLQTATSYRSDLKDGQLRLRFTAPLPEPINPFERKVVFSVYDPTYYIRMEHRPEHPPRIQGQGSPGCQLEVRTAKPSAELIARAYALDQSATPDENLGHLFAEKVVVLCP